MGTRVIAALVLSVVSPFCVAKQDCDVIAGDSAGAAEYLYETAEVKTNSRLHFYSAPHAECRLPAHLINGDTVEVLRSQQIKQSEDAPIQTFRYVRYRDAKGLFATGWVTAEGLAPVANPLPVTETCQLWANTAMPGRVRQAPPANNHYQVQGSGRASFYTMPNEQCRSASLFLIPGDLISAQEQSDDDFLEVVYYTADRRAVRGWLKKSQLQPVNSGDRYRDDINPLSTDKATRIATLNLRHDYQCVFYESWNAKKAIEFIVREDHQAALCRGGADPVTSPPTAYISIDKTSGEISWPDVAEGFKEE